MSAGDLELLLFRLAGNNTVGLAYSLFPIFIARAVLIGGSNDSPNANLALGIIYGASVSWVLALWAAWFVVRETIRRASK